LGNLRTVSVTIQRSSAVNSRPNKRTVALSLFSAIVWASNLQVPTLIISYLFYSVQPFLRKIFFALPFKSLSGKLFFIHASVLCFHMALKSFTFSRRPSIYTLPLVKFFADHLNFLAHIQPSFIARPIS